MNWQIIVAAWCQFVLASAVLLLVARVALIKVREPVERLRLIILAIAGAIVVPLLMAVSPFTPWRLLVLKKESSMAVSQSAPVARESVLLPSVAVSPEAIPNAAAEAAQASPSNVGVSKVPLNLESPSPSHSLNLDRWQFIGFILLGVHAVAAVFFLGQWLIGVLRLRYLWASSTPAPAAVQHIWKDFTRRQGDRAHLLVSNQVETPLIFGWLRPTVLLPGHIVTGDRQRLRFCLAHEWSHILRSDIVTWRAVWLCQFLLWHQPLFWVLRRELRICQDLLADQRAVASSNDAVEYCQLLVDIAKSHQAASLQGALTFLDHPSQLRRRITMLLKPGLSLRSRCSWAFSLIASPLAVALVLLAGSVRFELGYADEVAGDKEPLNRGEQKAAEATKDEQSKEKPIDAPRLKYEGIVIDKDTGKGIPDAVVVVRRLLSSAVEDRIVEETKHQTNADGKYSFEIPPEQVAQFAMYIELDVDHANYAARKGEGYSLTMIRKNEKSGERPFFEKVELNAAEPITGTLLTPDGKPAAGVKLLGYSKLDPSDLRREYGSFTDTLTNADGHFRLNLIKGGVGVYWILPRDFAIVQKAVGKTRGDLGKIQLQPGIRTKGRVLSADGKPVAGVAVNIVYRGPDQDLAGLNVSSSVERGAISDEEGQFSFEPLPAGDYEVSVAEYVSDPVKRDRKRFEIPGVFVGKKVTLKEGVDQEIELQAVPHVVFQGQYVDSKGKNSRGHEIFLFGELDGQPWFGQGRPDANGTIALRVPHGLKSTRVQLMTNEHGALRYRMKKDGELQNKQRDIDLGTMNDDVEGFQIVRYVAPLVLISAVDEDKQPIKDFKVTATYPWGSQEYVLEGELRSDISFEHQNDGRYRTSQLLPDEEVTYKVTAPGFDPASEKLKLAEGAEKELVVTLKKKDATPAKE